MSEVIVSFDKLTVLIGVVETLAIQETLEAEGYTVTIGALTLKGSTIWRRLENALNIDLKNAEIYGLLSMLVSPAAKERIDAYITSQEVVVAPPATDTSWQYRIPLANLPAGSLLDVWLVEFLTADAWPWIDGEWIYVRTNGACTAPGTEVA